MSKPRYRLMRLINVPDGARFILKKGRREYVRVTANNKTQEVIFRQTRKAEGKGWVIQSYRRNWHATVWVEVASL